MKWQCINCQSPINPSINGQINCELCQFQIEENASGIWDIMPNFEPGGFPIERCQHLIRLQKHHFWFKARNDLLIKRLKRFLPTPPKNVIEFGCGTGTFLHSLREMCEFRVGIDGHMQFLNMANHLYPELHLLHTDIAHIPIAADQFDLAIALDVLEHVDSIELLNEAYRLIKPEGYMLITVPAFQFLWSAVDEAAGHRCRYSLAQLTQELSETGWRVAEYTYYQFFLLPFVWLSRYLNRNKQPKIEHYPPPLINKTFLAINTLETRLFYGLSLPFGSSLVVLAQKDSWAQPKITAA